MRNAALRPLVHACAIFLALADMLPGGCSPDRTPRSDRGAPSMARPKVPAGAGNRALVGLPPMGQTRSGTDPDPLLRGKRVGVRRPGIGRHAPDVPTGSATSNTSTPPAARSATSTSACHDVDARLVVQARVLLGRCGSHSLAASPAAWAVWRRVCRKSVGTVADALAPAGPAGRLSTKRSDVSAGHGRVGTRQHDLDEIRVSYGSEGWGFESLRARYRNAADLRKRDN